MADDQSRDMDEPIKINLDPDEAVRGLLAVDPEHDGVLTRDGEPRCTYVGPASKKRCIHAVGHMGDHHVSLTE